MVEAGSRHKRMLRDEVQRKERQMVTLEDRCRKMEEDMQVKEDALCEARAESAIQQQTVAALREQLIDLEKQNDWITEKKEMEMQIENLKADLRSGNRHVDEFKDACETTETMDRLREKCLEYSRQLTAVTGELAEMRASSVDTDKYRKEEAKDLRMLTDSQAEKIKDLQEALAKSELQSEGVDSIKRQLLASKRAHGETKKELERIKTQTSKSISELQVDVDQLKAEKQAIEKSRAHMHESDEDTKKALSTMKRERDLLQVESRRKATKMQREKQTLEAEYLKKLEAKDAEIARLVALQAQYSAGESSGGSSRRSQQSGGSVEEDLRKELRSVKKVRDRVQSEFTVMRKNKDTEISEVKSKLEDRDETISTLVKSSVTLEEQAAANKMEIDSLRKQVEEMTEKQARREVPSDSQVMEMKKQVEKHRRSEESLTGQVFRLRKQVQAAKHEAGRIRAQAEAKGTVVEDPVPLTKASPQVQQHLKERDEAIANLVKQSMTQDGIIADLRDKLSTAQSQFEVVHESKEAAKAAAEIKQLRQEAEVFAGQVIELDEEIEKLKSTINEKEERIVELEKEMENVEFVNQQQVVKENQDLKAEIDELSEANKTQQDELRLLRRKEREQESLRDELFRTQSSSDEAKQKLTDLQLKLESMSDDRDRIHDELRRAQKTHREAIRNIESESEYTIADLKRKLDLESRAVESLRNSVGMVDELELQEMREEVSTLRNTVETQAVSIESASSTIRELENMLAEKTSEAAAAHEQEKEELLSEIEALSGHLDKAREELRELEEERVLIGDFKQKLEAADEAREASEKSIVDSYERKISLLKLDKDVTIDNLRKELVQEKEGSEKVVLEASTKVQSYEAELNELREEMAAQLEQRETRIFALESTLDAQEQLVQNMRVEMDHLQGSMENAASGRREEVDEMQQELLDLTSTNSKQEREIKSLEMQLEQEKASHQIEVVKLTENVTQLEAKISHSDDLEMESRLQTVKERLEKLSWRNNALKEENAALKDRLLKAEANTQENAEEDMAHMKQAIIKLRKKVKEQQVELKAFKEPVSTTSATNSPERQNSPKRLLGGFLGRRNKD